MGLSKADNIVGGGFFQTTMREQGARVRGWSGMRNTRPRALGWLFWRPRGAGRVFWRAGARPNLKNALYSFAVLTLHPLKCL